MTFFDNLTIPRKLIVSLGLMLAAIMTVNAVIYVKSTEVKQTTLESEGTRDITEAANLSLFYMVNQLAGLRGYLADTQCPGLGFRSYVNGFGLGMGSDDHLDAEFERQ